MGEWEVELMSSAGKERCIFEENTDYRRVFLAACLHSIVSRNAGNHSEQNGSERLRGTLR